MRKHLAILFLGLSLSGCIGAPQDQRAAPTRQATGALTPRPEARQCLASLGASKANFTPLPDQYYGAGCSTLNTVKLAGLRSDDAALALSNLGPVTCPLASTFADWARYGVDRAARQVLGSPLVRIETMGSYSCRNVAGSGRRSAHATANAIDVAAFVLADGRRISLTGQWDKGNARERQFLSLVHQSACKRFGTVLGPAYNAAHRDHFHLELSGRAYCR
jgi:hypothetical protein